MHNEADRLGTSPNRGQNEEGSAGEILKHDSFKRHEGIEQMTTSREQNFAFALLHFNSCFCSNSKKTGRKRGLNTLSNVLIDRDSQCIRIKSLKKNLCIVTRTITKRVAKRQWLPEAINLMRQNHSLHRLLRWVSLFEPDQNRGGLGPLVR